MDNNINAKLIDSLFKLIFFSVCGVKAPNEDCRQYVCDNIEAIYNLAVYHDVSHIVADAVNKLGLSVNNKTVEAKLKKQMFVSVVRYERLNHELAVLCEFFEKNKIYNIPLKGSVIRSLYREPWLRTSCDIDILVHNDDLEKTVLLMVEKLGFEVKSRSSHDVCLVSESGVNVELHFTLMEDDRINSSDKVLADVWNYAHADEGFVYRMSLCDEMIYFYHIAHMAKHFQIGGCGIKPFIDHEILNEKVSFDRDKRNKLLEEGRLKQFEESATHLCNVWFSDSAHTSLSKNMEQYILYGGVYGNADNRAEIEQIRHGGKLNYLVYKIWLPYDKIKTMYPVLEKHKWLMPVCELRRWGRLVFKGEFKRSKKEIKMIGNKSDEKVSKTFEMMSELGLEIK